MMKKKNGFMKPSIICMIMVGILILGTAMLVVANQPPVADADPDHQTVVVGEEAWFTGNRSYDLDGYIVSYYWDFGLGMYLSGETVTFVFNAPGNYTVTLIVTDDCGDTATDTVTVNVLDEEPPPNEPMVWIESLTTDKQVYDINELITTTVVVERGNDMLTYVWEGTLTLEVFDDVMALMYTEDQGVALPTGGSIETFYFEFILTESGDYLVRATLYDIDEVSVDIEEIWITVSEDQSGGNGTKPPNDEEKMAWIESLTTDKDQYDVNEVVKTQVIVKRGDDDLDYVWEGILILEVFDDALVLVYSEEQEVSIPCSGWTQTLDFEFALTAEGDYLVSATLYDQHDELMDVKEICITVGDGTPPPNNGTKMVWIESLTTDKDGYDVNETVKTQVVVKRGDDLLTYVWEGTLLLEVFDSTMALVFSDERPVYLPAGGMTETHEFEFELTEPGEYLVRATLTGLHDDSLDIKEICITVGDDNSGGNGTVPPDDLGLFTGDRAGAPQEERDRQAALIIIVLIVLVTLSAYVTLRQFKRLSKIIKRS